MSGGVIIYGDPHGDWEPLLTACRDERPDAVVILGDCDLELPLHQQIGSVFDAGIRVRWIPGNHDVDTVRYHDNLWGDFPEGNLHARWEEVDGLIVAGLGGVFKERVWYPRFDMAKPVFASRHAYLRQVALANRWRGGLPLHARDTIFPEDAEVVARFRAHFLVTHEAPSYHRHGFVGVDMVAAACRARLIVHGHHHESVEGRLPNGTRVRGLAKAEVLRLREADFR